MKLRKIDRDIKFGTLNSTHQVISLISLPYFRILGEAFVKLKKKGDLMSNLFYKYLNERLNYQPTETNEENHLQEVYGPIVTISRQAGCAGKSIAKLLQKAINKNVLHPEDKWQCLDKEMMYESAKKLNLPVRKIKYVYHGIRKSNMDEIFESLSSRYYKSDKVIRRTIVEVMKKYARKGNMVMIGRAGVALSPFVTKSFNIRLVASINWRTSKISQKHEISDEEAQKYIVEVDKKRMAMIEEFSGGKMEEALFDIIFNCEQISKDEIVETCLRLMRVRSFIQ